MKFIREISAEEENARVVPLVPGTNMLTIKCDPVKPVPEGTIIAMMFRVIGYDPDCDGSLMARLEQIEEDGVATGLEVSHLGLYPDTVYILDDAGELERICEAEDKKVICKCGYDPCRPQEHGGWTPNEEK